MPAGVAAAAPADGPDVHVLVPVKGHVLASLDGRAELALPELGPAGQFVHQRDEFALVQGPRGKAVPGHSGCSTPSGASKRSGFLRRRACSAAWPKPPATGRA